MKAKYLLVAAIVLFLLGLSVLWATFQGTIGLNTSFSSTTTVINICGKASGGWAVVGMLAMLLAVVAFLAAIVRGLLQWKRRRAAKLG